LHVSSSFGMGSLGSDVGGRFFSLGRSTSDWVISAGTIGMMSAGRVAASFTPPNLLSIGCRLLAGL
jgi:hypothetical protein